MRENNMQSYLVNTVHDSVVAEIHPDEGELFDELAVQSFTTDVYEYLLEEYGIEFNLPLGVEIKTGTHWSVGEEVKYNIYPNQ